MYSSRPYGRGPQFGGVSFGLGGPPPRDIVALLAVLFATFTLGQFQSTAIVRHLLLLSPEIWERGQVWRLLTYGFAGYGGPSLWILLELFMVYWFGKDVFQRLGRSRFWTMIASGLLGASVVAVVVELFAGGLAGVALPFQLMQGQRILLITLIAAFATMYRDAVIYLFFVLPIRAKWFIWLGILFGFMGFLSTRDIAGFAGICAATGSTYWYLAKPVRRKSGRGWWRRWNEDRFQRKVDRAAKRRGLRVVRGGDGSDEDHPTIH